MKFYLDITSKNTPQLHEVLLAIARAKNSDWKIHVEPTQIFVICVNKPKDIGQLQWKEVGKDIK